jgi:hypothetical protein
LDPPLEVGHTAHPTVYLNNLSFTNTFANIDKDLYNNAELHLQVYETETAGGDMTLVSAPITLDIGNYSLPELEEAIAKKLYELVDFDKHKLACDELHTVGTRVVLDFADKHAPGSSGGVAVTVPKRTHWLLCTSTTAPRRVRSLTTNSYV